jgi:transposase IS66 family protein
MGGDGSFSKVYRDGGVVEAACLAHTRRKFWDVREKTKSTLSREALERIAAFYTTPFEGNRPISVCGRARNTSRRSPTSRASPAAVIWHRRSATA